MKPIAPGEHGGPCGRLGQIEIQVGGERPAGGGMEPELELGDDTEVPAAPAQAPEEVRVLRAARPQDLAIGGDDRVRRDVVA